MNYFPKFIQWINFPPIPKEIIKKIPTDYNLFKKHSYVDYFARSDSFNEEIDRWCKNNICKDIDWGFQIITSDCPIHIDSNVETKFHYIIFNGGDSVYTRFWSNDHKIILDEYVIPENRWHIFKANSPHSVVGVVPGKVRLGITGKIF